jgi:WS/DGAT/MGAT family acyltransferase
MTPVITRRCRAQETAIVARTSYERLSTQDSSFLLFEHRETPMHVAAIAVLEAGALARRDGGGIDVQRIAAHIESRLPQLPRYRRRLVRTPVTGAPIWIDDARFSLDWHLRRAALPQPGTASELRELVGRILSQRLERTRPLWEMWIVEGLADDRFALVAKTHHSLVDGVAGANLLTSLFDTSPESPAAVAPPWTPAPAPSRLELLLDEVARGIQGVREAAASVQAAAREPREAAERVVASGTSVMQALQASVRRPAPTTINGPIGPHRRVAWLSFDLDDVKAVKNRLGGTVNDVVLAVVAGGLHRFLGAAHAWPTRLDYRVVVPVNMRAPGEVQAANRVSAHFLSLPLEERDPLRRYRRVRECADRAKRSRAAEGFELMTRVADRIAAPWLTRFGVQVASGLHPYHLIVTNVPGPPFPLYLLGAPLVDLHPHLPLFAHQGLGIAALSYCGRIRLGLVADFEQIPDLAPLEAALAASFSELEAASRRGGARQGAPARRFKAARSSTAM